MPSYDAELLCGAAMQSYNAELWCRVGMWSYDAELHFRTAPMEVSPLLLSSLVMPSLAGMDKVTKTKDTSFLRVAACQAFRTINSLTLQGSR